MIYTLIPARLNSARLAKKHLLPYLGKPLLWHTLKNTLLAEFPTKIITGDPEIANHPDLRYHSVLSHQIYKFNNGTERLAAYATDHMDDDDIIVDVQGDEISIDPELIKAVASATEVYDLASAYYFGHGSTYVTVGKKDKKACKFSRDIISGMAHIGIYGYRVALLQRLAVLRPTLDLEQISWTYWGKFKIHMVEWTEPKIKAINNPYDYEALVKSSASS